MEIIKITEEDFIPDMINTVNDNFDVLLEAITDLNNIINDGDAELKSLKVEANSNTTQAVNVTGKVTIDGDIETSKTLKGKNLNITEASTFNGNTTFKEINTFEKETSFEKINSNGLFNIKGDITTNVREISESNDTDTVAVVNNTYNINIENDYVIILNEQNSDLNTQANYALINPKAKQTIKFVVATMSSDFITLKLNDTEKLKIENPKESFELVYDDTNETWVIINFSLELPSTRIV